MIKIFFLILICIGSSFASKSMPKNFLKNDSLISLKKLYSDSDRLIVGYRLSDSTGIITIKHYAIQQLIISSISHLQHVNVTSEPPTLLVSKNKSYLGCSIADASGNKITIAIELKEKSSNEFVFNYRKDIEIHMGYPKGSCNSCEFIRQKGKIIGAKCNAQSFNSNGQTLAPTTSYVVKTLE